MTDPRTSAPDAPASGGRFPDPIRAGLAAGWKVVEGPRLADGATIEADVAIVGTGAGGGVTAEILAQAGLRVVMIEEGPLKTTSDFRMREAEAYPSLYQESAGRKTADKAINILQGRCVGGGTTVNWTTSFRTPTTTLAQWRREQGLAEFTPEALAPWFERMEARLSIGPWEVAPNANNAALAKGAAAIGISHGRIRRNVRGCGDLGYCGMGCPIGAKQDMLVTTIPGALARGATLVVRTRALRLVVERDRVVAIECAGMDAAGIAPGPQRFTVRAKRFVAAAGGIGTPALLLRSALPDPHGLVGKRTFLHPVVVSAAVMPERIDGFSGAPQTVYSDHYLDVLPPAGPMGFKIEAPPIHPILVGITLPGHGNAHAAWMRQMPNLHVQLALLRDGFHPESPGGTVRLRADGTPELDYPLTDYVWDGARRAFKAMAELQFAAGASKVMPIHGRAEAFTTNAAAQQAIAGFDLKPLVTTVVSAHVMGGAPLGVDPARSVVDPTGRHHHLANLYVLDGSLFPTSIGANPQLSIFGIVAKLASGLAADAKNG
jgi:choline dehydrogenase-like flavoprotein